MVVLDGVVDMDVGYKASDPGSKHYTGFFLFHFILHSKVGLKLFFMYFLLKETIWLQPMLPNANLGDFVRAICCVPGSSFLTPSNWKKRRPWGRGCGFEKEQKYGG